MKTAALTITAIAILLAGTASWMSSIATVNPVPLFTFKWVNDYDADASNELTLVLSTTNLNAPLSNWCVIGATRDGIFSVPETNPFRFFTIINCDSNTMRFSAPGGSQ